jgi:hypothetical protein
MSFLQAARRRLAAAEVVAGEDFLTAIEKLGSAGGVTEPTHASNRPAGRSWTRDELHER